MVRATVLPGVVREVAIQEFRLIKLDEEVEMTSGLCLIALDGERERWLQGCSDVKVRLERSGPHVVDINKAIGEAAEKGFFTSRN